MGSSRLDVSSRLSGKFKLIAYQIIDNILIRKPLVFNTSIYTYVLPLAAFALADYGKIILNIIRNSEDIMYELIGPVLFTVGILLIGSIITPELKYANEKAGIRILEQRINNTLRMLIKNNDSIIVPSKAYIYTLLTVNILSIIWLYFKSSDKLFTVSLRLAIEGISKGYMGLLLNISSTCIFIFFWNAVGLALAYFLWVHQQALFKLSKAIKEEIKGESRLRLDVILENRVLNTDKPVSRFLYFRWRIMSIVGAVSNMMKRLLTFLIFTVILTSLIDIELKGNLTYTSISAMIISIGLMVPISLSIYTIVRWGNELQTFTIIELKNIQIKAFANHDNTLLESSKELEHLIREFKHTLIPPRELWEIIAALITLIAAIISIMASLH